MNFDYSAFYHDLEVIRQQRKLTWHAIWRKLPQNVPCDVGTRMKNEDRLPRQVLIPLAAWSGLDLTSYELNA